MIKRQFVAFLFIMGMLLFGWGHVAYSDDVLKGILDGDELVRWEEIAQRIERGEWMKAERMLQGFWSVLDEKAPEDAVVISYLGVWSDVAMRVEGGWGRMREQLGMVNDDMMKVFYRKVMQKLQDCRDNGKKIGGVKGKMGMGCGYLAGNVGWFLLDYYRVDSSLGDGIVVEALGIGQGEVGEKLLCLEAVKVLYLLRSKNKLVGEAFEGCFKAYREGDRDGDLAFYEMMDVVFGLEVFEDEDLARYAYESYLVGRQGDFGRIFDQIQLKKVSKGLKDKLGIAVRLYVVNKLSGEGIGRCIPEMAKRDAISERESEIIEMASVGAEGRELVNIGNLRLGYLVMGCRMEEAVKLVVDISSKVGDLGGVKSSRKERFALIDALIESMWKSADWEGLFNLLVAIRGMDLGRVIGGLFENELVKGAFYHLDALCRRGVREGCFEGASQINRIWGDNFLGEEFRLLMQRGKISPKSSGP